MAGPKKKQPKRPRSKKRRRRFLLTVLAIALVPVLLVVFLPSLCSLPPIRRAIVQRISKQMDGSLEVASWRLRWFGPSRFSRLRVKGGEGETVAEIESVEVERGLIWLLVDSRNLGRTHVEKPNLYVVIDEDGRTNIEKLFPPRSDQAPSAPAPSPPMPPGADAIPYGDLVAKDGTVTVDIGDGRPFKVRDLVVELSLGKEDSDFSYRARAKVGSSGSPLVLSGSTQPNVDQVWAAVGLETTFEISLKEFQLGEISPILARLGVPVQCSGLLTTASMGFVSPTGEMDLSGKTVIRDMELWGDALNGDRPTFDLVQGDYEVEYSEGLLQVKKFKLASPVADLDAAGILSLTDWDADEVSEQVTFNGAVRMDQLARRFPNTLRLVEGLDVNGGVATAKVAMSLQEGTLRTNVSATVRDLAATHEGSRFGVERPIVLTAELVQTQDSARLASLRLDSSFATMSASGSLDEFDATLTCNLGVASRELGQFFDLGDRRAEGRLRLDISVEPGKSPRSKVGVHARANDFVLRAADGSRFEEEEVRATLNGSALIALDSGPLDIKELDVKLFSATLGGTAQADRILLPKQSAPKVTNGYGRIQIDLGRLRTLLHVVGGVPEGALFAGGCGFSGAVTADAGTVTLSNIDGRVQDLDFRVGERRVQYPMVRVAGGVTIRPADRGLSDVALTVQCPPGRIALKGGAVADWRTGEGLRGKAEGSLGIPRLREVLDDALGLPADMKTMGRITFDASVSPGEKPGRHAGSLAVRVRPLIVVREGKPRIEEKSIAFDLAGTFDSGSDALTFAHIALTSEPLRIAGRGALTELSGARRLTSKGTLACNFGRIAPLLAAFTGAKVEIEGDTAEPYVIDMPLGGKSLQEMLAQATASVDVAVKRAQYMGVETGAFTLPLHLKDGQIALALDVPVNEGRLAARPVLDARKAPAVLQLKGQTSVLKQVKITDRMADEMLALALPIFESALRAEGVVDLDVSSATVPLVDDIGNAAALTGRIALSNVTFQTESWLAKVLTVVKLNRRGIILPDQRVDVSLKDGRFTHSRLVMAIDKYPVLVSGSVGIDRSLDMLIELPITRELVRDKKLYELLKGQTIKVPVTGTTKFPRFDHTIVQRNMQGLMKHAAEQIFKENLRGLFK